MNKNDISAFVGNKALKLKNNSPEILIAMGITAAVGAAVWACKKTLSLPDELEKNKNDISEVKAAYPEEAIEDKKSAEYKAYVKELAKAYAKSTGRVLKLYAGPVLLGTAALGSVFAGTYEGKKLYTAATAACATYETAYKNVLKRVENEYGEDALKKIKYGIHTEEITETETTKSGKEKEVKKKVAVMDFDPDDPSTYSPYARFYDEACAEWQKDSEYNMTFLLCQQKAANDKLRAQGHLFLNEVYDMLGIPRTKAGQCVGWLYDPDNAIGDNYVDFGLYDVRRKSVRDFVNGYERCILLDFNVDGNIMDKI